MRNVRVGWRATAGSLDEGEMIALFQAALMEEIDNLKKGKGGRQFDVYDGQRIHSSREAHIYRFLTGAPLKDDTPVSVIINGQSVGGYVVSSDPEGVNIDLEADKGELIQRATIQSSSYMLLEDLVSKFNKVRSGAVSLNIEGSMKLFGLLEPSSLSSPVSFSGEATEGYTPNIEQHLAIRKSLTQEVTFIWGPPGTGKTKTLGIILNQLIKAGKSVLLTSHTNAAVDELLKRFLEGEENMPYIETGKIIRCGIPSVLDDHFSDLLVDKIVEKQTSKEQKRIEELRTLIGSIEEKIRKYKASEGNALATHALLTSQTCDFEREEKNIKNLKRRISALQTENDRITVSLSNQSRLLEKAKTANLLKRILYGLNVERIEKDIRTLEMKLDISKSQLQSFESELEDSRARRDALSSKIIESRNYIERTISLDGATSLESLQRKIDDLSQEVKDKDLEIRKIQTAIEGLKDSVFNNALVVGCTLTRACLDSKIIRRRFDVLILDEASMATLPNVFFAGGLSSSHYIISGDFRQLSPIYVSDNERVAVWLKRDIFMQSGIVESVNSNDNDERLVMLREQYRMHPDICALISDAVYGGKLKTAEEAKMAKRQIAALSPFGDKALVFCDTANADPWVKRPKTSNSRLSPYSAAVSVRLASRLLEEGKRAGIEVDVGIVTPYSAQAQLISKILEDEHVDRKHVVASTIHKFQGNERECIIFDLVEGHPSAPGVLTKGPFIDSEPGRLITVAISRAEGKFVLVGNGGYIRNRFNTTDAVFQIMEKIERTGGVIDSQSIFSSSFNMEIAERETIQIGRKISECGPLFIWDESNFYDAFRRDLEKAKSLVVIFSPFIARRRVTTLINDFKLSLKKGIEIYVITRHPDHQSSNRLETQELIEQLRKIGIKIVIASKEIGVHEKFHDKIAVIDTAVFYHGSMNILSQADSSESMIAFRSRKTIDELIRNFDIDKIVRRYRNIASEHPSTAVPITKMIERKLSEKNDPGTCPRCSMKLVLIKGSDSLYFGCPNMLDKGCDFKKEVDKDIIKQAVASMEIKCKKCPKGHMIYRDGKYGPFLSCDQYHSSHCQSTMDFDDDFL